MYIDKNRLTTPFESGLNKAIPWNVYPRPQLKRDSFISLNGEWDFAITKEEAAPRSYSEKILVPFPPESPLSGVCKTPDKYDYLHYHRTFTIPEGFKKDRIYVRFGAVDRLATITVNGKVVGTHNDGYLPFYADITDVLKEGENEIHLRVKDNLSPIFPYGKQKRKRGGMWYTPTSGIWQTVWLESVSKDYIRNIKITPTTTEVKIEVIGGSGAKRLTLTDSKESFTFEGKAIVIKPKNPKCWTPELPYLYEFKIETETDMVESYFALREVGICDTGTGKRLTLNGKPYIFNGLLDQGYFPDGLFIPATPEGYENDIQTAKKLGFNMIRKHIKIEPAYFYYLCDKMGIAVFQDMVNNSSYSFIRDTVIPTFISKRRSDKRIHRNIFSREAFTNLMRGAVNALYNFPSVVLYTIFNEGWGQFSADEMYEKLIEQDPTRTIDATSGWFWQKKSDVYSHHIYFKKLNPKDKRDRPCIISEFGGYSYRADGHLFSDKNYGYGKYETMSEFEEAFISLYKNEVLPLAKAGVSAFVYTQLSDVEDETNGIMTYDRRVVKLTAENVKPIMDEITAIFNEETEESSEENQ